LATVFWARGSSIHCPSTKNRYSYFPGLKETEPFHTPELSFVIRPALVRHSLKVPHTLTLLACGANNRNSTARSFVVVRIFDVTILTSHLPVFKSSLYLRSTCNTYRFRPPRFLFGNNFNDLSARL